MIAYVIVRNHKNQESDDISPERNICRSECQEWHFIDSRDPPDVVWHIQLRPSVKPSSFVNDFVIINALPIQKELKESIM